MNIKTEDFYKDIANIVEKRFDTSNYECDRPLPTGNWRKGHYGVPCLKTKNLFILNR